MDVAPAWAGEANAGVAVGRVSLLKFVETKPDVRLVSDDTESQRGRVLVLDDSKAMGKRIAMTIEGFGHAATVVSRGVEAVQLLRSGRYDLLTCDIEMPEMTGLAVVRLVRAACPLLPVLMITSNSELSTALEALRLGAYDYVVKPFKPSEIRDKLERGFAVAAAEEQRERQFTKLKERIAERDRQIEAGRDELRRIKRVFKKGLLDGVGISVNILHRHNETLAAHSRRVGDLALRVGAKLGLEGDELLNLHAAGLLHDIGMLALSPDIAVAMATHGQLDRAEQQAYERHCQVGMEIVEGIERFRAMAAVLWAHHERMDGSGFPRGLVGEAIPLPARILAAVEDFDTFGSMTQPPDEWADPIARLSVGAGSHYDRAVVEALVEAAAEAAAGPGEVLEVAVADLVPGMKLASDICTRKGMVLVGEGQLLSADVIEKVFRLLGSEIGAAPPVRVEKGFAA